MAIIRQVSSKTAEGLSTEIAKAYEDGLGYNELGVEAQVGGVSETAQLDFVWPHGRLETKEVFSIDISNALSSVPYTGNTGIGSVRNYVFAAISGFAVSYVSFTLGSISTTTGQLSTTTGSQDIAISIRNVLQGSRFSSIVRSATVTGDILKVELFYSAGDLSLTSVGYRGTSGSSSFDLTEPFTNTVATAYKTPTPERSLSLGTSFYPNPQNAGVTGTKLPGIKYKLITIPGGAGGLSSSQFISHVEDFFSEIEGMSISISAGIITVSLDSGYATNEFRLTIVLLKDTADTARLYSVDHSATITTQYVHPTAEAHGTMYFKIKKPAIDETPEENFNVPVTIPETQSVLQLEELFKNSILNYVTNEDTGRKISDFLSLATKTSPQTIVNQVTFENFSLILDWGLSGRISGSNPAASQFVDETTLVGQTGATSSYVGTIDVNDAVDDTVYTIISLGNASAAQLRSFAGLTTGTVSVGDRVTATNVSSLPNLTTTVNRFVGGNRAFIEWDLFSTSSVLQPGGESTHFATLVKITT